MADTHGFLRVLRWAKKLRLIKRYTRARSYTGVITPSESSGQKSSIMSTITPTRWEAAMSDELSPTSPTSEALLLFAATRRLQRLSRPDLNDSELDFAAELSTRAMLAAGDSPISFCELDKLRIEISDRIETGRAIELVAK